MSNVIDRVVAVIKDRMENPVEESYVSVLVKKGEDKILQKLGEESVEVILAAKSDDDDALVYELADLLFHSLVLMGTRDIAPERITKELERRFGTSGLAEKRSRTENQG